MTIYSELETAIRSVALVANSEYPTMQLNFSHSNGTEPVGSYASINILDVQQIGHRSSSTLTKSNKDLEIFCCL